MSEHLILQQDDPEFPLDPQLLIHAMWKELFDLELIDFSILRFDSELDEIMFPISLKDCDYQNLAPDFTELFDFIYNPPTGSGLQIIEVPAWVKRYRYKDGPQIIQYLDGPTNNPFDEVLKQTHISESYTWPWILWAFHEAEQRNEIVLGIGKVVVDVLEESDLHNALAHEQHGILSQHLTASPVAEPGPAFEGFYYSGKEAEDALPVIESLLELEEPESTPYDNVYCHALMLFAVHPDSTPTSLELIASSNSAARDFLRFNPSVTPEILAKIT